MKIKREELKRLIKDELIKELNKWHHKKDGKFSSKSSAGCESDYFVSGGDRKRVGGSLTDKHDTGRGKRDDKGSGKRRCRDDSIKEVDVLLDETGDSDGIKEKCKSIGLMTFSEFMKLLNKMERSQKGELDKVEK
jgi:hypothetical protein